jgi:large subunit ribosomal protein L10
MTHVESKNHYKKWKESERSTFEQALDKYNYILVGNLSELPAKAEREFRAVLKKNGCFTKVMNSKVAIKALHAKGIKELDSYLKGPTLFALGNESPFKLYREIKKNAAPAAAKEGNIAPEDIYVNEGDTGIPPGPALTDFKVAHIDTQIRNGKIYIAKKTMVAPKGSKIDSKIATLLTKLNIRPMKILLDLRTVLDRASNTFYARDLLDVNMEVLTNKIKDAYNRSYYLAIGKGYITKQTIKPLLIKGYKQSKAVALAGNVVNKDTAKDVLVKAHRIAHSMHKKTNN